MSDNIVLSPKAERRARRRAEKLTTLFTNGKRFTRDQIVKLFKDVEILAELAGKYLPLCSEALVKFISRPSLNKHESKVVKEILLDYTRALILFESWR